MCDSGINGICLHPMLCYGIHIYIYKYIDGDIQSGKWCGDGERWASDSGAGIRFHSISIRFDLISFTGCANFSQLESSKALNIFWITF